MRLIDYFERGLRYDPERACLIDAGGDFSYREVGEHSNRTANALLAGASGPRTQVLKRKIREQFWAGHEPKF